VLAAQAAPTTTTLLYGPCLDDGATNPVACAQEELERMDYWQYVVRSSGTATLTLTLKKGSESVAEDVCSYTKMGFIGGPFDDKVGVNVRSSAGTLLRQSTAADTSSMGCYTDLTVRPTTTTTISVPSYAPPPTTYTSPSGGGSSTGGNGSCTYVHPYYRKDGTYVHGYWRGC
jgi:hypothetical protein